VKELDRLRGCLTLENSLSCCESVKLVAERMNC